MYFWHLRTTLTILRVCVCVRLFDNNNKRKRLTVQKILDFTKVIHFLYLSGLLPILVSIYYLCAYVYYVIKRQSFLFTIQWN